MNMEKFSLDFFKLDGKVAIVTGGNTGLGMAYVEALAAAGADVLVTTFDNNTEEVKNIVESLGRKIVFVQGDLTKKETRDKVVSTCLEEFGKIDILVNNAGISTIGLFMDTSKDDIDNVMGINILGAMYLSKHALTHMISKGKGNIINISSIWGDVGASCEVVYSSSKGAINLFTKSLAKEVAPMGVRVNAIAPGVINTEMNSFLCEDEKNELEEEIPMGRFGEADEIGKLVAFICNDSCKYLTGQVIKVDGGLI